MTAPANAQPTPHKPESTGASPTVICQGTAGHGLPDQVVTIHG